MENFGVFGEELIARETELEEYVPRSREHTNMVPELIARWVQIWWSNWLSSQWDSSTAKALPDL